MSYAISHRLSVLSESVDLTEQVVSTGVQVDLALCRSSCFPPLTLVNYTHVLKYNDQLDI